MLNFIRNLFKKETSSREKKVHGQVPDIQIAQDEFEDNPLYVFRLQENSDALTNIKFIYCLVGNIIKDKSSLTADDNLQETKHFSVGTRVYCYPPQWGDGYEKIKVIGLHRKSKKLITIIIASKLITNWRLKTVYNPHIIKEMFENSGWTDRESDKDAIIELVNSLNKHKV